MSWKETKGFCRYRLISYSGYIIIDLLILSSESSQPSILWSGCLLLCWLLRQWLKTVAVLPSSNKDGLRQFLCRGCVLAPVMSVSHFLPTQSENAVLIYFYIIVSEIIYDSCILSYNHIYNSDLNFIVKKFLILHLNCFMIYFQSFHSMSTLPLIMFILNLLYFFFRKSNLIICLIKPF